MKEKKNFKAHDILSDEKMTMEILSDNPNNNYSYNKEEIRIARIIYSFLTSQRRANWNNEREQTKSRLKSSVQRIKRNYQIVRWSIAASLFLALFSAWFLYNNLEKRSSQIDFAQVIDTVEPDSITHLILQDGSKIEIDEKESKIVYDQKGGSLLIGANQKVSQNVVTEKTSFNTLIVPYGKTSQITLYDGTKVWLNSGSKLVYPASNASEKRLVYMEGEAIFDVTHSKQHPFFVITRDFQIRVLGTVFNVSSYRDDEVSSAVLEKGSIELESREKSFFDKEKLTILPGTMAVYDPEKGEFQNQKVETGNYLSWRYGYFVFRSEPLGNIIKKLERYYNIRIVMQDDQLNGETFSGNLNLKNTPEEVLKAIAETTPFFIRRENEKIIINL